MAQVSDKGEAEAAALLAAYAKPPMVRAGMRVGLMGGSFDPPHEGHVHISLEAIKRLKLDQLWWLVSPANPLKADGPWPLEKRLQQCLDLTHHPKLKVTAFEVGLGSAYTAQTLKYLTRRFAATRFIWLMGGDNMASVDQWYNWQRIFETVPVAVLDRPGRRYDVNSSTAAHVFAGGRVRERQAATLGHRNAPAWSTLNVPLSFESSTRIRQKHRS